MNKLVISAIIAILTFLVTIAITAFLIAKFRKLKVGQSILEIGPNWHMKKAGTPTMGGIGFIIASIITGLVIFALVNVEENTDEILRIVNLLVYGILNGLIGIIDDLAKYRKKQNEGLKPIKKLIFQILASVLFLILLSLTVGIETSINIPIFDVSLELGLFYYPIAIFVLCGFVNAVNLTDGLDGLASSVSLTTGLFFIVVSALFMQSLSLSVIGALIIGITLGFLVFNLYPAKIFMGDTGSLFLGGLVSGCSILMNNIFLVLLYGFVFLVEALSVILQVVTFKLTKGKRLFLMAPIHHHFEKKGWSEMKIVSLFMGVNALFCILALFSFITL